MFIRLFCHSREGGNPISTNIFQEIPAFAGMTPVFISSLALVQLHQKPYF
jgi:hypothetical protein